MRSEVINEFTSRTSCLWHWTNANLTRYRLDVQDREIVGLIGPNGSGKSTLLKCIYRTLHPNAGHIELNGRSLDELSFRESALQMAVVAQHNQYQFDFSVMDIVLMGRMPHKKLLEGDSPEDYTIARRALEQVGMDHMETRNFLSLSGGEQQRVILARALTQESPCLILDEPTNHWILSTNWKCWKSFVMRV